MRLTEVQGFEEGNLRPELMLFVKTNDVPPEDEE